ncbi:MAG: T9SS type A sorting domain-containing protein [Fibrobacter sp.]|nr:T9SS type A sorting domain-containing protein [Fibrobacter sp.]
MDCRKIALTLGLAAGMSFASVSLSFYEKTDGYTTTNAKFELDQKSWTPWVKEKGYVTTTITGSEFSSGLTVTPNETCEGYLTGIVNYGGTCGSNSLAAYGYYDGYWYEIGAFSSGQALSIECDYSKIAFQAQTSSTKECSVSINSIAIGGPSDVIVTKASVTSDYTNYVRSNDTIYFTVPFTAKMESITPYFTGLYSSVTPSTAQDFSKGPVTYTFKSKSGLSTKDIVLNISRTPGDTNAAIVNVFDFCSESKVYQWYQTYSDSPIIDVTKSTLAKQGTYCTEGTKITHPQNSGDTGLVELKLYKWVPDSIRHKLYGRYSAGRSNSNYAGLKFSGLAKRNWYKNGEPISVDLFNTPIDLENTVVEVIAQNGSPIHYYKFKFVDVIEENNYLSQLLMIDTTKQEYIYPRTIYDPESPNDTGKIIYDLPYKGTPVAKLFACGSGDDFLVENTFWRNCERTFSLPDTNITLTITGKMYGTSGMYATLTKDYDKKTYALKVVRQPKVWPDNNVSGIYVVDLTDNKNFSAIAATPNATSQKFSINLADKRSSINYSDYDLYVAMPNPFATYSYEPTNYDYPVWGQGSILSIITYNEINKRTVLSANVVHKAEEQDVAELKSFFIEAGLAYFEGKIDQENKIVHVDLPFEINLKRATIVFAGPHKSYSENYKIFHEYDLSDTIDFDFHSADSSKTTIYKIVATYNPDMYKEEPTIDPGKDTSEASFAKILDNASATVKFAENNLIYTGDIHEVKSIVIYDALGNKVYSKTGFEYPVMNLEILNQGVYVVKVQTTNGMSSLKFTKKK